MGSTVIANGPLPVDKSSTLWRYVTLPTLLLYLDGKFRLSSIQRLQGLDPLEGRTLWDPITQTGAFSGPEYRQLFDYVRDRHLSHKDQVCLAANRHNPGSNQRAIFDHWHRLVMSTRYAFCLFESEHQSIAMWRLYAPKGGFAIKTRLGSLERGLEAAA